MTIAEKLLSAVHTSEGELLKLAKKHFDVNDEMHDSIRTNGITSLAIAAIASINHLVPRLPDSIRSEVDNFVERFPTLAKDIEAVAYPHCATKEEGALFFAELAINGMFVDPEAAATTKLNGAHIVRGFYNIRA